jgi:hypothetical protein
MQKLALVFLIAASICYTEDPTAAEVRTPSRYLTVQQFVSESVRDEQQDALKEAAQERLQANYPRLKFRGNLREFEQLKQKRSNSTPI